jgi:DNA-binding CsgD family transcriptional regulator
MRVARRQPVDGTTAAKEMENLARGVGCRALYSSDAMATRNGFASIKPLLAAGEEARAYPDVGFELVIVDDRAAVVRSPAGESDDVEGLVVRGGLPLILLIAHFESLWAGAHEITEGGNAREVGGVTKEEQDLLALLQAGLTDEAIARSLDLAPRTVQRRVSRLMDKLSARSRFQAGAEAARRGWT